MNKESIIRVRIITTTLIIILILLLSLSASFEKLIYKIKMVKKLRIKKKKLVNTMLDR